MGRKNKIIREEIGGALARAVKPMTPREILASISSENNRTLESQTKQRIRKILTYEAGKEEGLYLRYREGYLNRADVETHLRDQIVKELQSHGLEFSNGRLAKTEFATKEEIRRFHAGARQDKLNTNSDFLRTREQELLESFADGSEIDIDRLHPRLHIVEAGTRESDLFRYASLLWSVPVSQGFGRRVRFLIFDDHTGKLIGIFALGDPVFNLSCRDSWIGWDHRDRADRLYNVMNIFVLGAAPPFDSLLGGKLIAMLAVTNEVREEIASRYKGTRTVILNSVKDSRLALLTTTSALGRSSIYNRIKLGSRKLFIPIGMTKGWGHFHLNKGLFEELRQFLLATVGTKEGGNRFGDGPNWKIRTARSAIEHMNLPGDILRHGIRREVYGIPLASNFDSFLRGETKNLNSYDFPFDQVADFWKDRWLKGRALRNPEYKEFDHSSVSDRIRGIL